MSLIAGSRATIVERLTIAIRQHKWAVAFGVLTLAVAASAIAYFTRPSEAIDSVAVMPFVNVSGDPNTEYLSDGLTESIINSLSPNLKVIGFNSVLRYKGSQKDPQAIARELNVRSLLISRVTQRGNDLTINVELVDARDNRHLWGQEYRRKLADITAVPTEIAQTVSEKLRLRLTDDQSKRLTKRYTQSGEAYALYLRGRYYQRWGKKAAIEKSIGFLEQAVEIDANYAPAYAELGEAYRNLGYGGWLAPKEARQKEEWAALKVLQIDNTLAEGHVLMADLKALDLDWAGADYEYRQAIELDPNSIRARYSYGMHLNKLGRLDEAMTHLKAALETDPLSFEANEAIGLVLYNLRQYDRAIEQFQKLKEMDANFAHGLLAQAYQAKGMYQDAVAELEKEGVKGNAQLGYAYGVAGKTAEARRVLDELKQLSKESYVAPFRFALVYLGLGDKDQAFIWLNKQADENPYRLVGFNVNPRFDGLRSDPRFDALLHRLKQKT